MRQSQRAMASAALCPYLSPLSALSLPALAPNPKTLETPPTPIPNNSKSSPNLTSRLSSGRSSLPLVCGSGGGEATTYTHLPPKDDFSFDPSLALSLETYGEIKLYESSVLALESANMKPLIDHSDGVIKRNQKGWSCIEEIDEEDGGRGGDVFVEVDGSMNSLLLFRKTVHFRVGRGGLGWGGSRLEQGRGRKRWAWVGRKQAGARERKEDVVVKVAPGTVIREVMKGRVEGELLLDLVPGVLTSREARARLISWKLGLELGLGLGTELCIRLELELAWQSKGSNLSSQSLF